MFLSASIFYFTAGIQCLVSGGYSNPKRSWQLGSTGGAYEHDMGYDALYPKLSDPIKVTNGYPSFPFKAFYFDGSTDYVQVDLSDDDQFKIFSVYQLVYPESSSGTIFHYVATGGGTDGISDVQITHSISPPQTLMTVKYGSQTWQSSGPPLSLGEWHCIIIWRNMDTAEIGFSIDGVQSTYPGPSQSDAEFLGTPGTICLGKNINSNFFKGKMTCLLLFDFVLDYADETQARGTCDALSHSPGPQNLIDVDLLTTTTTTATTTTTLALTSLYMWLLDDSSNAYSVDGVAPVYPEHPQCSRVSEEFPEIPNRMSLLLDGAQVTYFDLPVSAQVVQNDLQMSFEVNPGFPSIGTILQFSRSGASSGILVITFSVSSTDFTLEVKDSTSSCGVLTMADVFDSNTWHYVMIGIDSLNLDLYVDSRLHQVRHNCIRGAVADTGTIRLGNNMNADDAFRGSITCLGIYDVIMPPSVRTAAHRFLCQSSVPIKSAFDMDICSEIPEMRETWYRLYKSDAAPSVGVSAVRSGITTGLRDCTRLCVETPYCRAYTVAAHPHDGYFCQLYDFVTRGEGLATTTGTDYYVVDYNSNI